MHLKRTHVCTKEKQSPIRYTLELVSEVYSIGFKIKYFIILNFSLIDEYIK